MRYEIFYIDFTRNSRPNNVLIFLITKIKGDWRGGDESKEVMKMKLEQKRENVKEKIQSKWGRFLTFAHRLVLFEHSGLHQSIIALSSPYHVMDHPL